MAPRVLNFAEHAAHLVTRLERQLDHSDNVGLATLLDECRDHLTGLHIGASRPGPADVTLSLQVRVDDAVLSVFSAISISGAPNDITVDELAIEAFHPSDEITAVWFESRFGPR